jgi:putative aldouronate transport system permease protein
MQSYRRVFENTLLMRSYLNTIIYSATGTTISLILLVLAAYPLSVNYFRGRKIVAILYIITMYFGGGLIPTYLLIQALGLLGTMWAVVLPPIAGVFHLLLVRSYFQRIPESLRESAFVDGASHLQVLGRIYLPLSLPIIATMSLFIVVGFWNEYFAPLIYIGELRKQPLQVILREILIKAEFGDFMNSSQALRDWEFIPPPGLKRSLQGASIIVSVLPLLFLYPFLQRYFVHGALIGAVKS